MSDREDVESRCDDMLEAAKTKTISFLVVGDPFRFAFLFLCLFVLFCFVCFVLLVLVLVLFYSVGLWSFLLITFSC